MDYMSGLSHIPKLTLSPHPALSHPQAHGIQHLSTPPYTPQRVALAEKRTCHIVETATTLLH